MHLNSTNISSSRSLSLILIALFLYIPCISCHAKKVSVEECDNFIIEKRLVSEKPNKWGALQETNKWTVYKKRKYLNKKILSIKSTDYDNPFISSVKCDKMFDNQREHIQLTSRNCWATGCSPTVYWFNNSDNQNISFVSYLERDESPLPIFTTDEYGKPVFKIDIPIYGDFESIGIFLSHAEEIPVSKYICCVNNNFYDCTHKYLTKENDYIESTLPYSLLSRKLSKTNLIKYVAQYYDDNMADKLMALGYNETIANKLISEVLSHINYHELFGTVTYDKMISEITPR